MTPRTTRELYGRSLPRSAFEPERKLPIATIAVGALLVIGTAVLIDIQAETRELVDHDCQPYTTTVDGQALWQCRDGIRVSSYRGDAL